MAASRKSAVTAAPAPLRVSFAKIREPLEVPDLLALQTDSFDRLLGNPAWQERVSAALETGSTAVPRTSGLEDIFEEICPIEDFGGSMSLSFHDHRFEPPKYTVEQCRDKDFTYAAPLFVTAEFMNNETGEIKSQTVFMGDFPLMTDKGTFIINGTERVVVSQLVRSPGVYFGRDLDKTSDKDIFSARIIPSRGAWLEFEIDKKDMVGVRVDRKRKQPVTVLLKALGWSAEQIRERFGAYESMVLTLEKDGIETQDEALKDIYRKLRPGEPPTAEAGQGLLDNFYFNSKRYDLAKVGRYKINKKLGTSLELTQSTITIDDMVNTIEYIVRLHAGELEFTAPEGTVVPIETDDIDHFGNRRLRTVGELIQNQIRTGLSRMERVVRERMTTQDVEAITPQTLINIRPVVASIKEFFGTSQQLAVHGPDQPAGRPDPQAPALRARPGRAVAGAGRVRGPRRAPVPLRPDVPDRDAGGPEHRPDRLARDVRPRQRVRVRGDPVPQGRRATGSRTDRVPDGRRGGPPRHRAGERAAERRRHLRRVPRARAHTRRRGRVRARRRRGLHGRLARARWCRSRPR